MHKLVELNIHMKLYNKSNLQKDNQMTKIYK